MFIISCLAEKTRQRTFELKYLCFQQIIVQIFSPTQLFDYYGLATCFKSPFGLSSGFCIKFLKIKNTTIHKIYTLYEITVEVYIMCMLLPLFSKALYSSLKMDETGSKRCS